MANLYVDGFEWLQTAIGSAIVSGDMGNAGWFVTLNEGIPASVALGRFGYGKCLSVDRRSVLSWNSTYLKTFPDLSTPSSGYIGLAIERPSGGDPNGWIGIAFYDSVLNTPQISVILGRNGVVCAYRGFPPNDFDAAIASANTVGVSKAGVFDDDAWYHLEAYLEVASSGGSIEVRLNTVPVLQVTGANTQATANAYFDGAAILFGSQASASLTVKGNFDDFYVNDTSGSSNNSWLGNQRVKTQFMIADGTTDQFTIGGSSPAATNWQSVLNQALDDTKYVYSATVNQIDLYTPDPILNAPLVHAVQLRSGLRQDDATQRQSKHVLRAAGSNHLGSPTFFTTQDYSHYFSRWEINPATGVSFTGPEVNALQVGLKLTA